MTIVAGPAGAPAIVFVHGTRLTGAMWTAQQAALADEFRTIAVDLPAHGSRAAEPFTLDAAAAAVDDAIADRGGWARDRRRPVARRLRRDGARRREPERVRGLVLSGATAEPVGIRMLPYLALAAAMDGIDPDVLTRLNARFFRRLYPAAIAEPIVAGGFWTHGGAEALRALVGERFLPRLAATRARR